MDIPRIGTFTQHGKQVGTASPTSETESQRRSHFAHPGMITITLKLESTKAYMPSRS